MKLLIGFILSVQTVAFAAQENPACALKAQKQNEIEMLSAKLARRDIAGISARKEIEAVVAARADLEKAEAECPMTHEEACKTKAVKQAEYKILTAKIAKDPMIDMDTTLTQLKAVNQAYKKAKAICTE